jgi:pantetheine-phosphate adenylyltransferase
VEAFATLVVEFARQRGARSIVKGLRAVSDFEWEFQMNNLNRGMAPEIETMYLMASPEYSFLSSRGVREIASFGGSVANYVPEPVARRLAELYAAGEL